MGYMGYDKAVNWETNLYNKAYRCALVKNVDDSIAKCLYKCVENLTSKPRDFEIVKSYFSGRDIDYLAEINHISVSYIRRIINDFIEKIQEEHIKSEINSGIYGVLNDDTPIEVLTLKKKIKSSLVSQGLTTLGELSKCTESVLRGKYKLSYVSVQEIREVLFKNDYSLADDLVFLFKRTNFPRRTNYGSVEIERLGLTPRTYNTLKRVGINTVADMESKTWVELRSIQSLGNEGFLELIKCHDNLMEASHGV